MPYIGSWNIAGGHGGTGASGEAGAERLEETRREPTILRGCASEVAAVDTEGGEALCDLSSSASRGRFGRRLFVDGAGAVDAVVEVLLFIDMSPTNESSVRMSL